MSVEKPFVNVLLLGESGGGKSTFINSFANYITRENLQEALLHDPEFCISARFVITDQKYYETIVSVGDYKPSSYKAGKLVTQEVADYIFELNDVRLRLIDTPGVGDSRGVQQDEKTIKTIVTDIAKYGHLNAIAFVLKSNVTVFNEYFKFCIDHLLSQLDEAACKNVIFIFTHSRGTFYRPGETLSVIQRVLEESRVDIPHSKENMFCLDNEAFRYLVAHSRGLRFTEQELKTFENSWIQSVECCRSLLHYIVGYDKSAGLKPQLIKVIKPVKPKDDKFEELLRFLADLSCGLDENISILNHYLNLKVEFNTIPTIHFTKATESSEAVYVCKSLTCTPLQQIGCRNIEITSKLCPLNAINIGRNCSSCNCPLKLHRSTKYLKEMVGQTVMNKNDKLFIPKSSKIRTLITSYVNELQTVVDALATIVVFMIQNFKVHEDPFIAYLRNEKHMDYMDLKTLYYKSKSSKQTFINSMELEDITTNLKTLKKLEWTGAAIKNIFGDDLNITRQDITKEKPRTIRDKYRTPPKIIQKAEQITTTDKKSYANTLLNSDNANLVDANQIQDAITKHKQSQSSTEIIKAQASTSRGTEMETQSINQELLKEIEKVKQENNELLLQQKRSNEQIRELQQFVKHMKDDFDLIKEQATTANQDLNDKTKNIHQDFYNNYRGTIKETRASKDTEMQTQFTNQELLDEMKTLKQQLLDQQKNFEKQKRREFLSIKIELTAKNQDLTDKFENFQRQQEQSDLNKLQATAKYQELIDTVENMKKGQENADLNQLQATTKYQELIDTVENNTKGQENLCKHIKAVEKKCEVQLERNHKLIKRHNEDLQEEIKNVKEFIQELSKEVDDMKEESIATVETASSTSQDETTQEDNNEQPSKFQKLIDDINNLKKFKEAQMSKEEEDGEKQQENSETANIEAAKFKKLQDLSNFKQFKEQKSANENGEFTSEVKRLNEQQDNISKQLEDLKCFIKDVLGNKSTDKQEEVNGGPGKEKMKKKKSNKNN